MDSTMPGSSVLHNSWSLFKFMSIRSVMLPNHLILCCPLLLLCSIFPSIRVFPISQLFASHDQSIAISTSASVLPMNIHGWFSLELTGLIYLHFKGPPRVFSNTTIQSINSLALSLLYVPTLTSVHNYWKIMVLTIQNFINKVMYLPFNMLSIFIIYLLPRTQQVAEIIVLSNFGAPQNKICQLFHFSLSICHEIMWQDAMILVFWMLSFKPDFLLSSFTLIKRLFSSSSHSAIRVVSPAYLRLFIFLPGALIPACESSSLTFSMIYSAYKLSKQGDNIQPYYTPFLIWKQSAIPYTILTVASWPPYRVLKRQVRWSVTYISLKIVHCLLWFTQSKPLE